MKRAIRFQLKNAFHSTGFLRVCLLSLLFSVLCFIVCCVADFKADILSVQAAYMQFFPNRLAEARLIAGIIMPLLACCAYSDSYLSDLGNHYFPVCATRMTAEKYYFSKLISVFFCGAFVFFLPQIVNYLLCLIAFPIESTNVYTNELMQSDLYTFYLKDIMLKRLYIFSPYLYYLLYIFISSAFSGLIAVIGYQLSFFVKNKIFVMSFAFIFINMFSIFCEFYSVKLDVLKCLFGLEVPCPSYIQFMIIAAIYIFAALSPIPFALRRVKDNL